MVVGNTRMEGSFVVSHTEINWILNSEENVNLLLRIFSSKKKDPVELALDASHESDRQGFLSLSSLPFLLVLFRFFFYLSYFPPNN